MQELVGRLTALDPEASESLKVVTYFDALNASGVGLDGLVRAAAALSGASAGAERGGRITRFDPDGRRLSASSDDVTNRVPERHSAGIRVWLERPGPLHANDEMVVERLALAVELLEGRHSRAGGLDIAIDADQDADARNQALARLRLAPATRVRLVATDVDRPAPPGPATVVPTRWGVVRATVATVATAEEVPAVGRVGLGVWCRADQAHDSWDSAVTAYRLTDRTDRVVDATDLGALVGLARTHDPDHPHPDVSALAVLDPVQTAVVRALTEADSIRSAAAGLGMHHSSVQARHDNLTRQLGYDPRSPTGRVRFAAAALLLRLTQGPS